LTSLRIGVWFGPMNRLQRHIDTWMPSGGEFAGR
tara:strand:- start:1626 stop:1727 length:102 start_codon:yes stop_codon:yes gene_type:complete